MTGFDCKKRSLFSATQHCFTLSNALLFSPKSEQCQTNHIHSSATSAMHWSMFCLKLLSVLLTQHYKISQTAFKFAPKAWDKLSGRLL